VQKSGKKRKFSEEFKLEAVELAKRVGAAKASEELGVHHTTIRKWIQKSDGVIPKLITVKKSYSDLEKENRRLLKENGYLKEINKVLKKSTAIFSSDHMGNLK
jgi:transposase